MGAEPVTFMAIKTYGAFSLGEDNKWVISHAEPHVCIALKHIFRNLAKTTTVPFYFDNTAENCHDLNWFMIRYPLSASNRDLAILTQGSSRYRDHINELEAISAPDHVPQEINLNPGKEARRYQLQAADIHNHVRRMLLADDMGLGKTITAMLCMMRQGQFPVAVVVQAHLPRQWRDKIREFTNLRVHIVKTSKMYNLPAADVYIYSYSKLASWVDLFVKGFLKGVVFDEAQELRIPTSQKYHAATILRDYVQWTLAMSGTPIYNYGSEIYWVLNVVKREYLGGYEDFYREWCQGLKGRVIDPQALGTYLREKGMMLRRTRDDVGRELPAVNKVVYNVGYRQDIADHAEKLAHDLAIKVTTGAFMERGLAARELDALARHTTGVAKAHGVAAFVRILLENDRQVLLGGWHRDVYDIWAQELEEYNPVFYTGEESPAAKNAAVEAFRKGTARVLIMSLRSGIGVDGLQDICYTVVHGELDWSPKVHDQFTARVDRDGQLQLVDCFYTVVDEGSDPVIMDILGLKASQAHGIVDPMLQATEQYSDESRIQKLAKLYLDKKHRHHIGATTGVEDLHHSVSTLPLF